MVNKQRIIVLGISGGSSLELSFHFIKRFPLDIMLYIVPSKNASIVCKAEKKMNLINHINTLRQYNIEIHQNITSKLASGSFRFESCIILPTSSNTLSCISNGLQNNLLTRVAGICLKEKRLLVLGVREMPLDSIMLSNMTRLAHSNVCIAPPIIGYYGNITSLESMQDFLVGKYFDILNIEHDLFKRWDGI